MGFAVIEVLTPQNIADCLGISRRFVYTLMDTPVKNGGMKELCFKVGANRRMRIEKLNWWIEQQENKNGGQRLNNRLAKEEETK